MRKKLTPKNGSHPTAILAGGPADLARELTEKLATLRGLEIVEHREYKKRGFSKPMPSTVDFVIILTDMIGHPDYAAVFHAARKANVTAIRTVRKWATMEPALRAHGITAEFVKAYEGARNRQDVADARVIDSHYQAESAVAPVQELPAHETVDAEVDELPPAAPQVDVELALRKQVTDGLLAVMALLPPGLTVLAELRSNTIEVTFAKD